MWADNSYVKDYIEMQNDTEADEKTHLEQIKRKLNEALERLDLHWVPAP